MRTFRRWKPLLSRRLSGFRVASLIRNSLFTFESINASVIPEIGCSDNSVNLRHFLRISSFYGAGAMHPVTTRTFNNRFFNFPEKDLFNAFLSSVNKTAGIDYSRFPQFFHHRLFHTPAGKKGQHFFRIDKVLHIPGILKVTSSPLINRQDSHRLYPFFHLSELERRGRILTTPYKLLSTAMDRGFPPASSMRGSSPPMIWRAL